MQSLHNYSSYFFFFLYKLHYYSSYYGFEAAVFHIKHFSDAHTLRKLRKHAIILFRSIKNTSKGNASGTEH